jgi:predicted anti-sigma-YlaC factor YlaD
MTFVDCLTCREALSARMDGEAEPAPAEQTDQHLATCAACRSWQARVATTSRMLRVRQAAPVPDLSAAILDMAVPPQSPRGWWARIALIVVAVAQLGLALTQILGAGSPADHGGQHVPLPAAEHLFNESTAWNLAVGIGLLWAAFRSRVTSGLIPVLGGFVLLLGVYSVQGLAAGTVAATRVAEHGLLLVGLGLLIVINRWYGDPDPRLGTALDEDGTTIATESDAAGETPEPSGKSGRPPLRPAGRHRAA